MDSIYNPISSRFSYLHTLNKSYKKWNLNYLLSRSNNCCKLNVFGNYCFVLCLGQTHLKCQLDQILTC